jgi:hypothetical protein
VIVNAGTEKARIADGTFSAKPLEVVDDFVFALAVLDRESSVEPDFVRYVGK